MTTKIKVGIITTLLCLLTLAVGVMFAATETYPRDISAEITFDAPSGMRWNPGANKFEIYNYSGISLVASGQWVDVFGNYGGSAAGLIEPQQATGDKSYEVMKDIEYDGNNLANPGFLAKGITIQAGGVFDGGGYILTDFPINEVTGKNYATSIIYNNYGLIRDVVSYYTFAVPIPAVPASALCSHNSVGGIIEHCKLIGNSEFILTAEYFGGIATRNYGIIQNCLNELNVSATTTVGGIVAYNHNVIIDCSNKGDISGGLRAGGIVGRAEFNTGNIIFQNCINSGSIENVGDAGGIVGDVVGNALRVTFLYCKNIGEVTGQTVDGKGGIYGYSNITTVTFVECYTSVNVGTGDEKKFRWHAFEVGDEYTPKVA